MFAVQGNLLDTADADPHALRGPRFADFDIAAVGLGFHHFDDPDLAARRLVARLRPGGVLFITDFLSPSLQQQQHQHGEGDDDGDRHQHGHHDHHSHHDDHHHGHRSVVHAGFSEERIRQCFERAGAGLGFALEVVGSVAIPPHGPPEPTRNKTLFFARGTKG